jgi:carbamoylphosphate synthase large subunit
MFARPRSQHGPSIKLNEHEDYLRYIKHINYPIILQQFVSNQQEFSIDAYCDLNGNLTHSISRSRDKIINGESFSSTIHNIPALSNLAKSITSTLKFHGPINIQAFYNNSNNQTRIIEINPRVGGAYHFSIKAGLHSPQWILEEFNGFLPTTPPQTSPLQMLSFRDCLFSTHTTP